jgi:hypothetical protein
MQLEASCLSIRFQVGIVLCLQLSLCLMPKTPPLPLVVACHEPACCIVPRSSDEVGNDIDTPMYVLHERTWCQYNVCLVSTTSGQDSVGTHNGQGGICRVSLQSRPQ